VRFDKCRVRTKASRAAAAAASRRSSRRVDLTQLGSVGQQRTDRRTRKACVFSTAARQGQPPSPRRAMPRDDDGDRDSSRPRGGGGGGGARGGSSPRSRGSPSPDRYRSSGRAHDDRARRYSDSRGGGGGGSSPGRDAYYDRYHDRDRRALPPYPCPAPQTDMLTLPPSSWCFACRFTCSLHPTRCLQPVLRAD
jgi:hypothetical protein